MSTYVEICGGDQVKPKNTGFKEQCLETKLDIPILSNGFEFDDVTAFKTKQPFKNAIAAKKLVPLFEVYELADASTEDTKFESGNFTKITAKGVEKITFECYLSVCAYDALKSYELNKDYREIFEFNEGGDYSGVYSPDGTKVRGRKITNISVTRVRATKDKIPYVKGEITFEDKDDVLNAVIVKGELSKGDLEGIYDVNLVQESATSTSIKVKAISGCAGGSDVDSLEVGNFIIKDTSGAVQSVSFVPPVNGIYEFTGTGFANGFTVELNGVIVQTNTMYEGIKPMIIKI